MRGVASRQVNVSKDGFVGRSCWEITSKRSLQARRQKTEKESEEEDRKEHVSGLTEAFDGTRCRLSAAALSSARTDVESIVISS